MTDATPRPEILDDGWTIHDNRWATLTIGGHQYRLRPPKVGEARKFDEMVEAVALDLAEVIERQRSEAAELDRQVAEGELARSVAEVRGVALARAVEEATHDAYWSVLSHVLDTLCGEPLPPEDEWPLWLRPTAARQLAHLNHAWKSLPPLRGAVS